MSEKWPAVTGKKKHDVVEMIEKYGKITPRIRISLGKDNIKYSLFPEPEEIPPKVIVH